MNRAKVLTHSISPRDKELVTFEIELGRCVLAEAVTHRANYDCWNESLYSRTTTTDISKNSASSRAIPLHRMIQKVLDDPYIPERFSANGPGMQAANWLEGKDHDDAVYNWLSARDEAIVHAVYSQNESDRAAIFEKVVHPRMNDIRRSVWCVQRVPTKSLHKQDVNRLLEPWGWVLQVVTATEWANFFTLRCDEAAAPAIRTIARMMFLELKKSKPRLVEYGQWHLPYVEDAFERVYMQQATWSELCDLSAARVAWTSYWPPEGGSADDSEKVKRTLAKLRDSDPKHCSPFESQATPMREYQEENPSLRSNLSGWIQARKFIQGEKATEYDPPQSVIDSWGLS